MKINVLYFAWLRERIGHAREQVHSDARTPLELIAHLRKQGVQYDLALHDVSALRVSINHVLADFSDPIPDGAEVAFFPPMTGG